MTALGRPSSIANLDPANDNVPYSDVLAFDVREIVDVGEVMEREHLGPNGGVLWAMEEVEANLDWLEERLEQCGMFISGLLRFQRRGLRRHVANTRAEETIILDPPGQPELTIHHSALPRILHRLEKLDYRVSLALSSSIRRR
jgi:hypothetical protein